MAAAGIVVIAPGSAVGIVVDVPGLAIAWRILTLGRIGQEIIQIVPGVAAVVPSRWGRCRAAGCGWMGDRMYPSAG